MTNEKIRALAASLERVAATLEQYAFEDAASEAAGLMNSAAAELEAAAAEMERTKSGARTLGEIIKHQCDDIVKITDSQDLIGDDGDGDWGAVWGRAFDMRAKLDAFSALTVPDGDARERLVESIAGGTISIPGGYGELARDDAESIVDTILGDPALSRAAAPEPDVITISRPVAPFGPTHVTENEATADYLGEVVRKIDGGYANVGGSNVTATVRKLLVDAADALRALPVGGETDGD